MEEQILKMTSFEQDKAMNRRTVVKAAAWAAPVVAIAATAPLAAASFKSSTLSIANQSSAVLSGPAQAGTPMTGSVSGSGTVNNSGAGWPITGGTFSANLQGPLVATEFLYEGSPLFAGQQITVGGYTWTVQAAGLGGFGMTLNDVPIDVPANGSVTIPTPVITYATQLNGTPTQFLQAGAIGTFSVSATEGALSQPIGATTYAP